MRARPFSPVPSCRAAVLAVALALSFAAASYGADTVPDPVVPIDVTVGHVAVAGLTRSAAIDAVTAAYRRTIHVAAAHGARDVTSAQLGVALAGVDVAVDAALGATVPGDVPISVTVDPVRVRATALRIARASRVAPANARWTFHGRAASVVASRAGSIIDATALAAALRAAAADVTASIVVAPIDRLAAKVSAPRLPPAIVIGRGGNWLRLYHVVAGRARLWRSFAVATGMPGHATPTGTFRVVVKQRNPWWYPPASAWARGMAPIPPGPGNPLGTRWMGLSAPDVGIHGTPLPNSIGHAASHGCIRMRIRDAEWLFARVRIGSPVRIIGS